MTIAAGTGNRDGALARLSGLHIGRNARDVDGVDCGLRCWSETAAGASGQAQRA